MKKKFLNFIFITFVSIMSFEFVNAENTVTVYIECGSRYIPQPIADLIHKAIVLLQIVIPIGIIIMGSLDFLKAVVASDADKMKSSQKQFYSRIIAGIFALMVFVIIRFGVDIFSKGIDSQFGDCLNCVINGGDACGDVTSNVNPFLD